MTVVPVDFARAETKCSGTHTQSAIGSSWWNTSAGIDSSGCPLVVVKRGPRGALARTPEGEVDHPAVAVAMVDATGAGDSFDAGFLAGRLTGLDLEASLRLGCACGALSTRRLGGTTAQPTLDEARALR